MENDVYYQKVKKRLERNKKILAQKQRAVARDEEILGGLEDGNAHYVPKTQKGAKKENKASKVTVENEKSVLDEIFEE